MAKSILLTSLTILISFVVLVLLLLWIFFGRGTPYPDLSTMPTLPEGTIEAAVVSERPIGNAAVARDGRVFFTVHPESNPDYPKLYVWENDQAIPFPKDTRQESLFTSPLGLSIDQLNRLWVIDPANHGTQQPQLIAFDLSNGKEVHRYEFPSDIAPIGSFVQDHQVSSDGRWIYIADVGFWAKRPGIIIYDTQTRTSRRVLNRHDSVYPQNYLIQTQIKDMSFLGGILEMKTGIDGIALSRDDKWVYYGAMNHDSLYRISTNDLQNASLSDEELSNKIELVSKKPLSDGFSIDNENNVFITDIEHQAVVKAAPDGSLETIIKDPKIRWADGLSFGPDGWLYLADSAIPHLVLQTPEHIKAHAPYYVWKFKPGTYAAAGQ